jgi:hypothetical protein
VRLSARLITFHGAFSKIGVRLFSRRAADGIILGAGQTQAILETSLYSGAGKLFAEAQKSNP